MHRCTFDALCLSCTSDGRRSLLQLCLSVGWRAREHVSGKHFPVFCLHTAAAAAPSPPPPPPNAFYIILRMHFSAYSCNKLRHHWQYITPGLDAGYTCEWLWSCSRYFIARHRLVHASLFMCCCCCCKRAQNNNIGGKINTKEEGEKSASARLFWAQRRTYGLSACAAAAASSAVARGHILARVKHRGPSRTRPLGWEAGVAVDSSSGRCTVKYYAQNREKIFQTS